MSPFDWYKWLLEHMSPECLYIWYVGMVGFEKWGPETYFFLFVWCFGFFLFSWNFVFTFDVLDPFVYLLSFPHLSFDELDFLLIILQPNKKIADAKLAKDFQAVLKEFQKAQRLAAERETAYTTFVPQAVLPSRWLLSEAFNYMFFVILSIVLCKLYMLLKLIEF